ncbi:Uncharacterised protein [Serratia fonticola]|nr:Uncharacterised protein [Serratia fonticola]
MLSNFPQPAKMRAFLFLRIPIMSHSLNMVIETPEVLTGHTGLICSSDIERLVTGREVALKQIEALMVQLKEIGNQIFSIGGGKLEDWAVQSGHRYGCHLTLEQDTR